MPVTFSVVASTPGLPSTTEPFAMSAISGASFTLATVISNVNNLLPPLPSDTVRLTSLVEAAVDTSVAEGVPDSVFVAGSNDSQPAETSSFKEIVNFDRSLSTSETSNTASYKVPCVASRLGVVSKAGSSFTFSTVTVSVSVEVKPLTSLMLTLMVYSPTSAFSGAPYNVPVDAENSSQDGNSPTLIETLSPSGSTASIAYENSLSSLAVTATSLRDGASFTFVA